MSESYTPRTDQTHVPHFAPYEVTIAGAVQQIDRAMTLDARNAAMCNAINEIRELHRPVCEHSGANCKIVTCPVLLCAECGNWPCPTVAILQKHGI